jgi:SpoVK/Ycf46/Vps4 family AAA+-type ATPase
VAAQSAALQIKDRASVRALAMRLRGAGTHKPLLLTGRRAKAAAEAIAEELGEDLYRVDLSEVVSKSIGETEKNLDRVFEDAGRAASILLFDEADALFGKRTEVKDSHDRFANAAIGYLLQRADTYSGIVLLVGHSPRPLPQAVRRRLAIRPFPPR